MAARKYISVTYTKDTRKKLDQWCRANGYNTTEKYDGTQVGPEGFKFHTTVMYSENESNLSNKIVDIIECEAFPVRFELLGENKDIPVMIVESPALSAFRYFYELMGLEDKWDEYKPHVSLTYSKTTELPNELPGFPMFFDKIEIEDIEEKDGV